MVLECSSSIQIRICLWWCCVLMHFSWFYVSFNHFWKNFTFSNCSYESGPSFWSVNFYSHISQFYCLIHLHLRSLHFVECSFVTFHFCYFHRGSLLPLTLAHGIMLTVDYMQIKCFLFFSFRKSVDLYLSIYLLTTYH